MAASMSQLGMRVLVICHLLGDIKGVTQNFEHYQF
jgi:hypothetical protein